MTDGDDRAEPDTAGLDATEPESPDPELDLSEEDPERTASQPLPAIHPFDPNAETAPQGVQVQTDRDEFPAGRCETCGWRNLPTMTLCEGCGSDLETGAPPPVDRFRPRRFDVRWLFLVGLVLLLVLAGLGARSFLRANAQKQALKGGEAALLAGEAARAQALFRKAIEYNPKRARAWAGLAEALAQSGEVSEALRAGDRAQTLDPTLPEAHAAVGRARLLADNPTGAVEALDRAHGLRSDLPDLLHLLAHAHYALGDRREARTRYREALARDPDSREAPLSHLRLGILLTQLNLLAEAETEIQAAEDTGAPASGVLGARGNLAARHGEFEEAVDLYEKALAERPDDPHPSHRAARILYLRLNRPDDALTAIERAIQLDGDQPGFLKLRGMILKSLRREDEAYESLRHAARLDRKDPEVLRLLAKIELGRGKLSEARAHLDQARAIDPNAVATLIAIARVAEKQKDILARIAALARAQSLAPEDAQVHFLLGEARIAAGDPPGAIDAMQRAASVDRHFEAPRRRLLALYLEAKRFDDAARVLEEIVRMRPDDVEAKLQLARLWVRQCTHRRYTRAVEMLDGLLEARPDLEDAILLRKQARLGKLREGG